MKRSVSILVLIAAAMLMGGSEARRASATSSVDLPQMNLDPAPYSARAGPEKIPAYRPRFGRERPVVAVVALASGAELTDYVVPYGILSASGLAEVVAIATEPGPVRLFPALAIRPDASIHEFDRQFPEGADYVIVPAVHHPRDRVLNEWVRRQAAAGATVVGICDGVLVLASAGLLEGRRATGHWYSLGRLARRYPGTEWVRDRRYVADGNVVTTTGVSASIPVSLAMVAAIGGRKGAADLALQLGVDDWSADHDSGRYGLSAGHAFTALKNMARFWDRQTIGVDLEPGIDEVSLALMADAWSRTYRSRVISIADAEGEVYSGAGLRLVPDGLAGERQLRRMISLPGDVLPGKSLDHALLEIRTAFGVGTAELVALQLEHPWIRGTPSATPPDS